MKAVVLTIDGMSPDPAALDQAAQALSCGELVVAPTETRYGLLVRADRQEYIKKLFGLKKRDLRQATALFVRDLTEAASLGHLTVAAETLSEYFLPGPLTLVLQAIPDWLPPRVVEGKIGLRCSSSATIRGLLGRLPVPLTATSANVSGDTDPGSVKELAAVFGDRVALYLDAGPLAGASSTVVDCSADPVRILREGAISREQIKQALGKLNVG
jgi:L-threonylcarbamoyladenylate synthase